MFMQMYMQKAYSTGPVKKLSDFMNGCHAAGQINNQQSSHCHSIMTASALHAPDMQCNAMQEMARMARKRHQQHQAGFGCGWIRTSTSTVSMRTITLHSHTQSLCQDTHHQVRAYIISKLSVHQLRAAATAIQQHAIANDQITASDSSY